MLQRTGKFCGGLRLLIAAASLLVAPSAVAAVIDVPPGADVQAALDGAMPGDVVRLLDGVHPRPSLLTLPDGVALEGESREGAILDGGLTDLDPPAGNHILFDGTTDPRTRVSNLTIRGGHSVTGGAFRVVDAAAGEISGNRITGNFATLNASAIWLGGTTSPAFRVAFNLIHDNFDSDGIETHAIDVVDTASATIQNNTIAYNDENGIFVDGTANYPVLVNNIIARNGQDFPPSVVLDPITGEPISGVSGNVGRGSCYFPYGAPPGAVISYNLFVGNQRAALLIGGPNSGDYEDPRDAEALESWIADNLHLPRGASDDSFFVDSAARDLRIRTTGIAYLAGDPALASSQGVLHLGAEQDAVAPSVPSLAPPGRAALAALLLALAIPAARGTLAMRRPSFTISARPRCA